jgi:DNA mismatch repair protein MutL
MREEPTALLRELVAAGYRQTCCLEPEEAFERLLQSLACRAAIKAGQRLETEEMVALLQQLDGLDHCSTCPHGRPLWWKFTMGEIGRIFGRS